MRLFLICGLTLAALAFVPAAMAGTFPGSNGRVAYVQTVAGVPQVFTMAASGADRRQVTHEASGADNPDWSADGRSLAFSVGGQRIGVATATGAGEHLIASDATATDPSWSPDRKQVAVAGVDYNPQGAIEDSSIYVVQADGSGQQRIVDGSDPVWSPDGRWIVFRPTPATSDNCPGIDAMRPDGSDLHRVVAAYNDGSGGCSGGGSDPSFSPDGKRVVYVAPNGRDLYKVSVHGGSARKLRTDSDPKSDPTFSPDGRSVIYVERSATRAVSATKGGRERGIGPAVSELAWQPLPR
jgi:Tol biopolymer transport system component